MSDSRDSEEVFHNEAPFKDIFNISPDAILVIDREGIIRFSNPAATELFGRSDLNGTAFGFPVVSDASAEIDILRQGKSVLVAEMRIVKTRWRGREARLAMLRDVSENVSHRRELQRSNKELEEFAYVVSHDMKSPLRNINNIVSILKSEDKGVAGEQDTQELLGLLTQSVNIMHRLIDDLYFFSQLDAISVEKSLKLVDLNSVISNVLVALNFDIKTKNATISCGSLPNVMCNDALIFQLFQNLISNSLKYTVNAEPRVSIKAQRYDTKWHFIIEDNGIGIDRKYWRKIFEPYERAGRNGIYEGVGIGLATCKSIVDKHLGKIWIESSKRSGSTLVFTLPIGNL